MEERKIKNIRQIIDGTIDACPPEMKTPPFSLYLSRDAYKALSCSEGEEPTQYRGFKVLCDLSIPVNIICYITDEKNTAKLEAMCDDTANKLANLNKEYVPYMDEWKKEINKLPKKTIIELFSSVGLEKDGLKLANKAQGEFIDQLTDKKELIEFLAIDKFIENLKEPLKALRVDFSSLDNNGLDQAGKIIDCILKNRATNGN